MSRVLALDADGQPWHPDRLQQALGALMKELSAAQGKVTINIVNDMWGQQGYGFLETYRKRLAAAGSSLHALDFENRPEQARETINDYIAEQTRDRIKNLLPPGSMTPAVRQVLTNAVYFKGRWQSTFSPRATRDRPFSLQGGEQVMVSMMQQLDSFHYAESEELQFLCMGYQESTLEMVVLLPRPGQDLAVARRALQPDALRTWSERTQYRKVLVGLPRFQFESSYSLHKVLEKMGMKSAFDSASCDFSGINGGTEPLPIGVVLHKTFVKVDEEGTEAAAATAMTMLSGSARADQRPPAVFTADRPFLLAIRDHHTGMLLFLGQVLDPRSHAHG